MLDYSRPEGKNLSIIIFIFLIASLTFVFNHSTKEAVYAVGENSQRSLYTSTGSSTEQYSAKSLNRGLQNYLAFDKDKIYTDRSIQFDGVDDELHLESVDSGSRHLSWTIWVYSETNSSGWESILRNFGSTNFQEHEGDEIGWFVSNGSSSIYLNTNYNAGEWVMYAGTFDGDNKAVKLYKNGNLEVEKSLQGGIGPVGSMTVGSAGTNEFFDGSLDNFRIYNETLSQKQVERLYNERPVSSSKLITFHNFEEGYESCSLTGANPCIIDDSRNL
ncbi:MAG: LamG domain-containing protein [Candidatus Nanohalobium sp.]